MSDESNNVGHADNVDHANNVTTAEHVGLAQGLEVRSMDPHRDRLLNIARLSQNICVLAALITMIINFADKHRSETELRAQVKVTADKLAASDQKTADTLNCSRRFQDKVDQSSTEVSVSIGELVVIITQIVPGPEREAAVKSKIAELDAANIAARKAVMDKAAYNNDNNPLPCPI